jgi:hypothetical protein
MILPLFVSLALAAVPASRIGVPDVREERSAGVAISKEVAKLSASFGPLDERPVTKDIFERALMKFSCEPLPLKYASGTGEIKKSDLAREIFEILQSKDVLPAADTATIRFRDMDKNDDAFEAAQGAVSLGIVSPSNGNFEDRAVRSFELDRMLARAFAPGCGLVPNDDPDNDKVKGEVDDCPLVPGSVNGCPDVSFRPKKEASISPLRPYLRVPLSAESDGFLFQEMTDIQEGDLFRAVIRSPKTGENLSESAPIEVK